MIAADSAFGSQAETHTLFGQTMWLVALTAGMFTLGAYLGRNMSYQLGWVWFIAALLCLFVMSAAVRTSEGMALGVLFAFGLLMGLSVSPTIAYYAATNPEAIWQAGGATGLFVGGFGAAGYATRRDLSALARLCFWALLALIVFGIVTIFVQMSHAALIYAVVGLVIFAGLTMFDFQRLRVTKDITSAPLLAASIFLDILNVFLFFLTGFRGRR